MHPVPVPPGPISPINRYKVADLVTAVSADSGQVLISGRSSYRGTIAIYGLDLANRTHWILDERTCSQMPNIGTTARLVRIDLCTLDHEVVWEGPRYGNFDKHWLSVNHGGHVLLTGSSELTGMHVMVRFESDAYELGSTKAVAMQFGQGSLPTQPLIDEEGYFFPAQDAAGRFHPVRVQALDQNHPNGISLESCL